MPRLALDASACLAASLKCIGFGLGRGRPIILARAVSRDAFQVLVVRLAQKPVVVVRRFVGGAARLILPDVVRARARRAHAVGLLALALPENAVRF